jgi:hypothetical protein
MSSSGTKAGNVISMFLCYTACKCHVYQRNVSANLPFLVIFPPYLAFLSHLLSRKFNILTVEKIYF